jgi:SAM-dependent methyltransferase
MSRSKYTVIGHKNLLLCNPIGSAKYEEALSRICFSATTTAETSIDFGSGKAEISIRLLETHPNTTGTALEWDENLVKEAQQNAESRNIPSHRLRLEQVDAKAFYLEECKAKGLSYDVTICVGSTHIFGGYKEILQSLSEITKPNGYLLVGDLYWRNPQNINPDFLNFLQMSPTELRSHEEHLSIAREIGNESLQLVWQTIASEEEFEQYERTVSQAREDYCTSHPEDPDSESILQRSRAWAEASEKWGRKEFGFGLYLFQRK